MAQQTPPTSLLILSKTAQTLAIVDPQTLKVIAREPVGNDPHEVIASSDGATAYVSNYGFGKYNTLAVIDLLHQKPLPSVDLGPLHGPHGLAFVDGETWFTAEGAKAIGRYSPATHKVDWILGTGQNRTHMIYVFPGAKRILVTNVSSGTVSIIDQVEVPMFPPAARHPGPSPMRQDWNETVVKVGPGSEGFDLSPDHRQMWVANAGDGTISVIDLATKQVVQTLQANLNGANRLKFTPDGHYVLVSTLNAPGLAVIDTSSHQVVQHVDVGHGAAGILMQPDGTRAFVACSPDNYVAVIDLHTFKIIGRIAPGGNPDGMAWAVRK